MKRGLGLSNKEMGDVLSEWNNGVLDSFLIEITRDILYFNDEDGKPLLEKIMDSAGQKGTGKWTAINALDMGMPVTLIGEAVFSRCLSSLKGERVRASKKLNGPTPNFTGDKKAFLKDLEQALYASKIISYAQGFMLMQAVSFPCSYSQTAVLTQSLRLPRSTAGSSTSPTSPSCGAEAASSVPSSSRTSPRRTAATPSLRTSSLTISSTRPSTKHRRAGERLWRTARCGESPHLPSQPLCPSTMDTGPRTSLPTSSRRSVTTLVPTPSASSPSSRTRSTPRARISTSTGPDVVAMCLPLPTTLKLVTKIYYFTSTKIERAWRLMQHSCLLV